MNTIFTKKITIRPEHCRNEGQMKLSALLYESQEVSGKHCEELGFGWDIMDEKGLFWAVLRHKIYIYTMPKAGQTVILETWPMPTTRSAYPRAVRARDASGQILFEVVSLWVIMDRNTRAMVLPGKSGIAVPGFLRGDEPAGPGSIAPGSYENTSLWQVSKEDLDRNGHVNNSKYLDHVEPLLQDEMPKEVTVCYLSEVLPEQEIDLNWAVNSEGVLTVNGCRRRTDVHGGTERVFALRLCC